MSESEQEQRPKPVPQGDKARKLKYWGLGLVGLGLVFELLFIFLGSPSVLLSIGGMIFCGIGLVCYAKSRGSSIAWGLAAVLLVIGPLLAVIDINREATRRLMQKSVKRKWGWVDSLGLVAIIGILAAIAIPNVSKNYAARSRQSEAKVGLGGIFESARELKEKNRTFVISDINQLGYMPGGTSGRYSLWYAVNGVPTAVPLSPGSHYKSARCDVTTPPTTVIVAASATGFTAAAKGNIIDGNVCDEWSINEIRELKNTLNGLQR